MPFRLVHFCITQVQARGLSRPVSRVIKEKKRFHETSLRRRRPTCYRGTSLARKRTHLGPYRKPMSRVLGGSQGGRRLMGEVPLFRGGLAFKAPRLCITHIKARGPSRTCVESNNGEEEIPRDFTATTSCDVIRPIKSPLYIQGYLAPETAPL